MVMGQGRSSVGAHYGMRDWIMQRVTAVVLALYSIVLLVLLFKQGTGYAAWAALFANGFFKIFTFVALVSLFLHAWVGMRDLWMDYIKPTGLRLVLQVFTIVVLLVNTAWTIHILWGLR
jgi:succinate dehydrogenase / fumarate reductase, membrane anchor subunit